MILCPWGFPGKSTGVACPFLLHLWLSNASIVMVVGLHAINPARGASSVVRNLPAKCRRRGFNPLLWKIPWRRKGQPTPVLLPEKIPGWRILLGYCPWGHKELDITERLRTHTHTHTQCFIVCTYHFSVEEQKYSLRILIFQEYKWCELLCLPNKIHDF